MFFFFRLFAHPPVLLPEVSLSGISSPLFSGNTWVHALSFPHGSAPCGRDRRLPSPSPIQVPVLWCSPMVFPCLHRPGVFPLPMVEGSFGGSFLFNRSTLAHPRLFRFPLFLGLWNSPRHQCTSSQFAWCAPSFSPLANFEFRCQELRRLPGYWRSAR